MTIVLYANRNTGLVVMSYLVAMGHNVKYISDDLDIIEMGTAYNLTRVVLETMRPFDLFICCHGDKIIEAQYLQEGKMINIHPCLYKYKGHNPIKRYIENGDTEGTVESQYMIEEVDAGEVIEQEFFKTPVCKTYADFYNIAIPYYLKCIHNTLEHLQNN